MRVRTQCFLLPVLGVVLAACGGGDKGEKPLADASYASPPGVNNSAPVLADPGNKKQEAGVTLGVNAYLWRAALETLGFMPLASADPFGGVIITDWYSPPTTSGERFKATAYILGRQLRADGIHIVIFRQIRDGGQWIDAPANAATASDIENKVLARARELKSGQVNKS